MNKTLTKSSRRDRPGAGKITIPHRAPTPGDSPADADLLRKMDAWWRAESSRRMRFFIRSAQRARKNHTVMLSTSLSDGIALNRVFHSTEPLSFATGSGESVRFHLSDYRLVTRHNFRVPVIRK